MRRTIFILVLLLALAIAALSIHYDGPVTANEPKLSTMIEGSETWYSRPQLASSVDDPQAIYVVVPELPVDHRFAAVRVDTSTGAQSRTFIQLGYGTTFRPLEPATDVEIDVRGVRWNRPAFHLMTLPDGKGPGFHTVDSATGEMRVVTDGRNSRELLSRKVFNSSSAAELLSQVYAERSGRWIAAVTRDAGAWTLHLFAQEEL